MIRAILLTAMIAASAVGQTDITADGRLVTSWAGADISIHDDDGDEFIANIKTESTVTTNTTITDNSSECHKCLGEPTQWITLEVHDSTTCPKKWPATERYETIICSKTERLSFDWRGVPFTTERVEILWTKKKTYLRKMQWVEEAKGGGESKGAGE